MKMEAQTQTFLKCSVGSPQYSVQDDSFLRNLIIRIL